MGSVVEVVRSRVRGANLQLSVEVVRDSPQNARFVEDRLKTIPGVIEVSANPATGGVRVHYDPRAGREMAEPARALAVRAKQEIVVVRQDGNADGILVRLAKFVAVVAVEVALQRVLGPLFLPRRC